MDDTTTIGAAEFKARCLKLMDEVAATGNALVVTKNGKPVVRILPAVPRRSIIGRRVGRGKIIGDIISPIYEEWAKDRDAEVEGK